MTSRRAASPLAALLSELGPSLPGVLTLHPPWQQGYASTLLAVSGCKCAGVIGFGRCHARMHLPVLPRLNRIHRMRVFASMGRRQIRLPAGQQVWQAIAGQRRCTKNTAPHS